MNYFSRYITTPLALTLVGLSLAAVPLSALARDGSNNDADRVASVIPATPALAVFVGSDGTALVRGAKVTAINGSTITVTTTWGASNISWTLRSASSTSFSSVSGTSATLSTILVGDILSFKGALDQTGSAFTVNVTTVRDWSKNIVNPVTVKGSVLSVNTALGSFVLSGGSSVTVTQTSSTTITLNGTTTPFSSVITGAKVTVTGTYTASTNTIAATSMAITSASTTPVKKESFSWGNFVKGIRDSFGGSGKK